MNDDRPAESCPPQQVSGADDPRVCSGRGQKVPNGILSGQERRERYRALPEIIQHVVDSCDQLRDIQHLDDSLLPDPAVAVQIINVCREVLFPGYFGERRYSSENLSYHMGDRLHDLYLMLSEQIYRSVRHQCRREDDQVCPHCKNQAERDAQELLRQLPEIRRQLDMDVKAAYNGDPAARGLDEIILSYPGVFAVTVYRIANRLWQMGIMLVPRMMTEHAHAETGIDIHPGATIGDSFFIDHGTGVVIGETTIIGNRVKLYQGVTLGALSFPKDACGNLIRDQKRHPTIEDDVTIYAQATILGGDTVVGAHSTVGGNVWLTESVEPYTFVSLENPKLVVRQKRTKS